MIPLTKINLLLPLLQTRKKKKTRKKQPNSLKNVLNDVVKMIHLIKA